MRFWRLIWVLTLLGVSGCGPAAPSAGKAGTTAAGTAQAMAAAATATPGPAYAATNTARPASAPSPVRETPAPAVSPSALPTAQPAPPAATYTPTRPAASPTLPPTASATSTRPPDLAWAGEPAVCDTAPVGRDTQPSPNGAFWAGKDGDIAAAQGGPCARLIHPKWAQFAGWTADSRYAVYSVYDQYGNSAGLVFDTAAWKQFGLPQDVGLGSMSGSFPDGPVGVGPQKRQVLLGLGKIIILPGTMGRQVLDGTGQVRVVRGTWSPNEERLAFLAVAGREAREGTLFVAAGDGRGARPLATVAMGDWYTLNIGWTGPDQGALVTTAGTWVFDANTLTAALTPAAPRTTPAPPAAPATATPGS